VTTWTERNIKGWPHSDSSRTNSRDKLEEEMKETQGKNKKESYRERKVVYQVFLPNQCSPPPVYFDNPSSHFSPPSPAAEE
jgi:hypothetical protein